MSTIAIRVENLSKKYEITVGKHRHDTLRDQISDGISSLFRSNGRPHPERETFWALKDVSFEVKPAEVIGIIGRNGAGKSTLLKILSRITDPTSGRAEIHGRVGSLLEVGTGFHGELTGRENIYLNGAILGMKNAEIDRKFDEILDFSGVEKFIDTPVKRYSSGMYVRLAFAVAAYLEPEVLIVDEVLAVGDAGFQTKCLGKMEGIAREGRTVLFVSHSMPAILRLCPEAILLEEGRVVLRAPSSTAIEQYLNSGIQKQAEKVWRAEELPSTSGPFRPISLRVCNASRTVSDVVRSSQAFSIEIKYQVRESVPDLRVGISLYTSLGELLFQSFDRDDLARHKRYAIRTPGYYVSRCLIPANVLNKGTFMVGISASVSQVQRFFWDQNSVNFTVDETGGVATQWVEDRGGFFRPALDWDIERLPN
jgi:lipopolysaccharide transport system ATP-binding protein